MKKRIVPWLSSLFAVTLLFMPSFHAVRAASPVQLKCPSCDSFGIQTSFERKEAPAFSLKGLDGKQVSLGEFKGTPVFIVFWASW